MVLVLGFLCGVFGNGVWKVFVDEWWCGMEDQEGCGNGKMRRMVGDKNG